MKDLQQNLPKELQILDITSYDDGYSYLITTKATQKSDSKILCDLDFIKGGRNTPDCKMGITHEALAYVIADRLRYFIDLYGATEDQDKALEHIMKAIDIMEARTIKRSELGTLGNNGEDYSKQK